jgi:CHAD domain-containing protein
MLRLALAHSERERRRARRRDTSPSLGLLCGETLADGLRRMAVGQLDLAIELLGAGENTHTGWGSSNGAAASNGGAKGAGGALDEKAVHDTRKAIKRLRALLRLLRGELGERAYRRENDALRDLARRLSGARDASVMLATLDALIEHKPRKLGRRRGVIALRRRLAADSARVGRHTLAGPHERAELLGELHALRWRVSAWSLPAGPGVKLIDSDLERIYRQGRSRAERAARGKGDRRARMLAMHSWRKRVKDLRYAAEMLRRSDRPCTEDAPTPTKHGRDARAAAKSLRKLASRADELGELLGEEHDLAVLEEHLRAGEKLWRTGQGTRKALLRAIAKRRRALRKRALRQGERLYTDKPSRFVRRVRAAVS